VGSALPSTKNLQSTQPKSSTQHLTPTSGHGGATVSRGLPGKGSDQSQCQLDRRAHRPARCVSQYARRNPTGRAGHCVVAVGIVAVEQERSLVKDEFTGKNAFGGDVSAVAVIADTAEVVDALAAAPPATATAKVSKTQTQHGLSITIEKVEFADAETRVFVSVRNASSHNASFYDFNAKAVQHGQHLLHVG
jgi:hypothetical protein